MHSSNKIAAVNFVVGQIYVTANETAFMVIAKDGAEVMIMRELKVGGKAILYISQHDMNGFVDGFNAQHINSELLLNRRAVWNYIRDAYTRLGLNEIALYKRAYESTEIFSEEEKMLYALEAI